MAFKLNLEKLESTVSALGDALRVWDTFSNKNDMEEAVVNTIRAGVIQNFEVTYDQCWKLMNRWLNINVGRESLHIITRKDLFREAAEYGLIDNVEQWFKFHAARNNTSHNYDISIALETLQLSKELYTAAYFLAEFLANHA